MSKSLVLRTVLVIASIWAVLLLTVLVWSVVNVPIAGVWPEAIRLMMMMTLPFTGGISIVAIAAAVIITRLRSQQHRENSENI